MNGLLDIILQAIQAETQNAACGLKGGTAYIQHSRVSFSHRQLGNFIFWAVSFWQRHFDSGIIIGFIVRSAQLLEVAFWAAILRRERHFGLLFAR